MSKQMRNFLNNVHPEIKMGRSKFDLSYSHKTTMDVGDLVPIYIQEIYPGDSLKEKTTFVCRTTNPYIRPVMDNLFMDIYFFFVPNRLVWNRWQEFMGENVTGFWTKNTTPEVPQVQLPYNLDGDSSPAIDPKSIASYFGINIGSGIPVGSSDVPGKISALPFRANALIYNEWFRNENFEAPAYINIGDYTIDPVINKNAFDASNIFGLVPKVNKLSDYFTSCLPEPQKGDAVDIPIGNLPVVSLNGDNTDFYNSLNFNDVQALRFDRYNSGAGEFTPFSSVSLLGLDSAGNLVSTDQGSFLAQNNLYPRNLFAIGSEGIGNINDLRFAFQLQKLLEKDARGGTRYVEYLAEHFGVISPDARLQRPEFLGGKRVPLQLQEVAQTSASDETSPLAQLSAYSATINQSGFSKGFVEHGFVIGYAVIRQRHTYQQGIEKFLMRKTRYDYYDPVFANIGEQPVYTYELYAEALTEAEKERIFGWNEAWADLRYRPGRITGYLNSTSKSGFDIWHFGDVYTNKPTLSNAWMKENPAYVDRTLSVPSETAPNFVVDFYNKVAAARVLPLYSIPGLVDHH